MNPYGHDFWHLWSLARESSRPRRRMGRGGVFAMLAMASAMGARR